ncbi:hypothetical protein ACJQWK_05382 [Exserohilum turcicum]|uniref:Uncharacterized protein n=1 Tax=Exserohilum turcicum (strain 28A) TaxID=671987 RepID=R0JLP0_EXST2|nr:uncharacterized protein SETTUDRAFT_23376 [Exserohilum turcica Et28A]EOA82133.1 hypothetical protein SETTUDRAFT_23376 [Exserohilum turcica Et28A]
MSSISDHAQEHAEQQLVQTILERKHALSRLKPETPHSEVLSCHHDWADKLHAAILNYMRDANTALIARILKLPRELRDAIYMYLWDFEPDNDPNAALLEHWGAFDDAWFYKSEDVSNSPWLDSPKTIERPPYFVDKAFMGPVAAREILECFRDVVGRDQRPDDSGNLPDDQCTINDLSILDFVTKDVFGVGMTMEELTRNLNISIQFNADYMFEPESLEEMQNSMASTRGSNIGKRSEFYAKLNGYATAFIGIPATNRIITADEITSDLYVGPRLVTLEIFDESDCSDSALPDISSLVVRMYKGLRANGFEVNIRCLCDFIQLNVQFEDDVWGWTDADWENKLPGKGWFADYLEDSVIETRTRVWLQLREYLFGNN